LGTVDSYYSSTFLFKEDYWKEQLECDDLTDIIFKIQNYLTEASNTIQLQISEAMISYKERRLLQHLIKLIEQYDPYVSQRFFIRSNENNTSSPQDL